MKSRLNKKGFLSVFLAFLFLILVLNAFFYIERNTSVYNFQKNKIALIYRVSNIFDNLENTILSAKTQTGNVSIVQNSSDIYFRQNLPNVNNSNFDSALQKIVNFTKQEYSSLDITLDLNNFDATTLSIEPFDINYTQENFLGVRENNKIYIKPKTIDFNGYSIIIDIPDANFTTDSVSVSECVDCFEAVFLNVSIKDWTNLEVFSLTKTLDSNKFTQIIINTNDPASNDVNISVYPNGVLEITNNMPTLVIDVNTQVGFSNASQSPQAVLPKGFVTVSDRGIVFKR